MNDTNTYSNTNHRTNNEHAKHENTKCFSIVFPFLEIDKYITKNLIEYCLPKTEQVYRFRNPSIVGYFVVIIWGSLLEYCGSVLCIFTSKCFSFWFFVLFLELKQIYLQWKEESMKSLDVSNWKSKHTINVCSGETLNYDTIDVDIFSDNTKKMVKAIDFLSVRFSKFHKTKRNILPGWGG